MLRLTVEVDDITVGIDDVVEYIDMGDVVEVGDTVEDFCFV